MTAHDPALVETVAAALTKAGGSHSRFGSRRLAEIVLDAITTSPRHALVELPEPEPIPVKMKMADAEQVTDAMVRAIREWWLADPLLRRRAPDLVYEIHRGLVEIGVVLIQVDAAESGSTTPENKE